jgi:pantothenate kinase
MESVYESLTARALKVKDGLTANENAPSRVLIALAGVPGAGKSTIAAEVVRRLNMRAKIPYAAVLPMDGFHLPRSILDRMPNKAEAYNRRGAAWTFDAPGVVNLVEALHQSRQNPALLSKIHLAPGFDHILKDPVENAIAITPDISLIILEGNWLLLDEEPWSRISTMVDDTWLVDVAPPLARDRVARRHIQSGIEATWEDAVRRTERNDLPNGELVRLKLITPALRVESIEEVRNGTVEDEV